VIKKKEAIAVGGTHVAEQMSSKYEALNSKPSAAKRMKQQKFNRDINNKARNLAKQGEKNYRSMLIRGE
jgi:uncharacterized surface anchored protein